MIQNNLVQDILKFRKITKSGQIIWVKEVARRVKDIEGQDVFLIFCEDITDSIQAQKEKDDAVKRLAQTEKMVILGQLASAISHEINNPLDIMMSETETLADQFVNPEIALYLGQIKKQIYRIHHIARDVLNFSKDQTPRHDRLELNIVVMKTIDLIQNSLNSHVKLELQLASHLPSLQGDAVGLEIVFKNILLNALESIEKQGQIVVITKAAAANQLTVTIKDTGRGISKHDIAKIFEPFYTTKRATGGSGLGLKISAEILRQHKGTIQVRSKPGKGTTVQIHLPAFIS